MGSLFIDCIFITDTLLSSPRFPAFPQKPYKCCKKNRASRKMGIKIQGDKPFISLSSCCRQFMGKDTVHGRSDSTNISSERVHFPVLPLFSLSRENLILSCRHKTSSFLIRYSDYDKFRIADFFSPVNPLFIYFY